MPGQILTFKLEEITKLLQEGKLTVVGTPPRAESVVDTDIRAEKARELFGEDFFG